MVIADIDAEEAILGTVAMADTVLPLLQQQGLQAEHFYRHHEAFKQVLRAADAGTPVDTVTVPLLGQFSGAVPNLHNVEAYARRVMEKARWREIRRAGLLLMDAAEHEDETDVAEAERILVRPNYSRRVWDQQRLAGLMLDRMDTEAVPGWEMPFFDQRLTPGTVWLWGGWTSHGKTVWVDQVSRHLNEQGADVWAWLNEMTAEERVCRHAASSTGIDLERVLLNDLTGPEQMEIVRAMKTIPWGITECPGWSAEEIARDIRTRGCDVAIVDILHRIPYETERDLARISRVLGDAAKLANVVILATVHLNRGRIVTPDRPMPTLADIKGASAFEQDADGVGMVWRQDDKDTGRPTDAGWVYTLKVRMGKPSGLEVWFDGATAKFERKPSYA